MSSLLFQTGDERVIVATDTLATDTELRPMFFTTKAHIVPHLRIIMAGTGTAGFLDRWYMVLNGQMVVKDIDHLDYHTPGTLRSLWQEYLAGSDESLSDKLTTTVYHFGFGADSEVSKGIAYRSYNNFASEPLSPGLAVKPRCEIPTPTEPFPANWFRIMQVQRYEQSLRPASERVMIGGEMIVHTMTKGGYHVLPTYRFEDFEETERLIYDNHSRMKRTFDESGGS